MTSLGNRSPDAMAQLDAPLGTLRPNLFIVGAPRCGTTFWSSYLGRHPDVFFCTPKEPHFFNTDFPKARWYTDSNSYLSLFATAKQRIVGEASVRYLYSRVAAVNIYRFNPDARILIFLREQPRFLQSYHNQQLINRDEDIRDLGRAWQLSDQLDKRKVPRSCLELAFLDYKSVGRFHEQVLRYADLFSHQNVRVIFFEQWTKDPAGTYRALLNYLGLTDYNAGEFEKVHGAAHVRSDLLAMITNRPPRALLSVSAALKRLLHREKLGLATVLRRVNTLDGYRASLTHELAAEIFAYYADDNRLLAKLIHDNGLLLASSTAG